VIPQHEKRLDRLEEEERSRKDEIDIAAAIMQARLGRPISPPKQPKRVDDEAELAARIAEARARTKLKP